ncbi:Cytochrome P450 CYP82J17 [Linum perenne]
MMSMDLSTQLFALSGVLFLLLVLKHLKDNKNKVRRPQIPEIPGGLPVIGHLHLLRGKDVLCRQLGALADKYGSMYTIRLGSHPTVIISDYEAMKECFTDNDVALAARPQSSQGRILGKNYSVFGFASYGMYWRNVKKLMMTELLTLARIKALRHVQVKEVDKLVRDLYTRCSSNNKDDHDQQSVVVMSDWLQNFAVNIITTMIAGKRYFEDLSDMDGVVDEGGRPVGEMIREYMALNGSMVLSDFIPIYRWFDQWGILRTMKRVSKEFDVVVNGWIEEHKVKRIKMGADKVLDEDFIDVMLSVVNDNFDPSSEFDKETSVKSTATTLVIAATDTTAGTLTWILSNLINKRSTLEKAQKEMDEKVGRDRVVQDSDLDNLPYLQAIVRETLRLYAGPTTVPRVVREDITIQGYYVPKGTRFTANLWKLHRNPQVFPNPDEFIPERFYEKQVTADIYGRSFEYLPFGTGRRSCPGMHFAMQVVLLSAARLIQAFDFGMPFDQTVDLTEANSTTLSKKTPLEVVVTPRLPRQLYD